MIEAAINKILNLAPPSFKQIGERLYAFSHFPPKLIEDPLPEPLVIHTLTGLVDYIKVQTAAELDNEQFFVHVERHDEVSVVSNLNLFDANRKAFVHVVLPEYDGFPFGRWLDLESFIIQLQAKFELDPTVNKVLQLFSNIKEEAIRVSQDDGISQTVTAKSGVARVEEVEVPNPVALRPYRTFLEIEQPTSPFVLRMRKDNNDVLMAALFEADGGKWRLDAIKSIRDYLGGQLSEDVPIIA